MFAPDDLTQDRFLDGRIMVAQPRTGYRAAMDPVLLAASCPAVPGQSVLELGCGAGVASLCLGWRVAGLRQAGVELQPAYADLARQNAARNGTGLEVFDGDITAMPAALRARSFDHVIANPPYFSAGSGTAAADGGRETAQREDTPLAEWIRAGYRRLVPGGWLSVIQNADRLPDLLAAMTQGGGTITVLPIAARVGRTAGRVIVQARKGGRGPFRLAAPFVLHAAPEHGADAEDLTEVARAVLRHGDNLRMVTG